MYKYITTTSLGRKCITETSTKLSNLKEATTAEINEVKKTHEKDRQTVAQIIKEAHNARQAKVLAAIAKYPELEGLLK